MVGKAILFRWEDSDALKHHCGFCDRPLSHPGARISCFGAHAEPCFRFHQAMFMRNRGHTCDMCIHIDEHHYKRHHDMCERIRSIYESCGEDWPIIPEDEDLRGRSKSRGLGAFESDGRSATAGEVPVKKRDKKEQKRQVRAASRTKVITQEDIKYIDSVLHPAASQTDTETPNNPEEIEEIERHLRYNSQCYNDGQKRRDIRDFGRIPDADIDFGAELDRIFETLRIAELIKRNEKNRGLPNKELVHFKILIAELEDQIITDLVHAKRDELEIRMRRAAFLRYTNRATYDTMVNRYANKDWKTGEKYQSSGPGSTSSSSLTAVEEEVEEVNNNDYATQHYSRQPSSVTLNDADRRHIEQSHKKLGSDGFLEEIRAIQESKAVPNQDTLKPPPSLRIVNTDIIPPQKIKFRNPWKQRQNNVTKPFAALKRSAKNLSSGDLLRKCSAADSEDGWQTVGATKNPTSALSGHRNGRPISGDGPLLPQYNTHRPMDGLKQMIKGSHSHPISGLGHTVLRGRSGRGNSTDEPVPEASTHSAKPKAPWSSLEPTRVSVIASLYQDESEGRQMTEKVKQEEIQANFDAKAQLQERKKQMELSEADHHSQVKDKTSSKLQVISPVGKQADIAHAPVESRKKKDKKKQREEERKTRRAAEKESLAPVKTDPLSGDTNIDSPSSELSAFGTMSRKKLEDVGRRISLASNNTPAAEANHAVNTVSVDIETEGPWSGLSAYNLRNGKGTKHTEGEVRTKAKASSSSGLHSVSVTRAIPSSRVGQAQELPPKKSQIPKAANGSVADNGILRHHGLVLSNLPKIATPAALVPTTKLGRHKDWVKFARSIKVDSVSKPLFTSNHPAYDKHADSPTMSKCPFESSGTSDCPYHKTYCHCIDPLEPIHDKYIVYPGANHCEIGPYNYIQSKKLFDFLKSQHELKGRIMLVEADLYSWLYTEGRNWRIEGESLKKLDEKQLPKRVHDEVYDYLKGYRKGKILRQVVQFQMLASKNERLRLIACRTIITEELLEAFRKKCEPGPDRDAICYCRDDMPVHPEGDDKLVECKYFDCPTRFFHYHCVEKLGYDKVTTWYCGFCERLMSVAAQKALHEAHAMHTGEPAPDFMQAEYRMSVRAVAASVDSFLTRHCGRH